jgi:Carbohydrate family 9 binding domain-like
MKCIHAVLALILCATLAIAVDPPAGRSRIYVTGAAAALADQGLASHAPSGQEAAAFQEVPAPGVRFQANAAQATTSPWVDSNAWRFRRGVQKANYAKLPAGASLLAAAEAFAYHVDAILNPDPADVPELTKLLTLLNAQEQPPLPPMANVGVIDDGSPVMGEVLNMLTRRNLLYRVVAKPDPKLDVTVRLGDADFPKESANNPSDFAARVRGKLGDDRRLVRLYGSSTAIAYLTGDGKRERLYLLSYSRNRVQPGLRVRVLGRYAPVKFAAHGTSPDVRLTDIENPENATEFSVPTFSTIAMIDLEPAGNTIGSTRAPRDFDLTADPNSPNWVDAPRVLATRDYFGQPIAGAATEIRSRWTDRNLYLLYICPYDELNLKPDPDPTKETLQLWNWDVAEAFIGSDFAHIGRYKELQVSPQSEWVDLDIDRENQKGQAGMKWNSGYTVKGRIDAQAKVWYGEMRIPFEAIDSRPPQPGRELRIGLYRIAGREPKKHYAWQPTGQSSFHVPQAFGTLVLQ